MNLNLPKVKFCPKKLLVLKPVRKLPKILAVKIIQRKIKEIPVRARVTNEIVFLNAFKEEKVKTAAATTKVDERGYFLDDTVPARIHGNPGVGRTSDLDYIDVASNQIISIATSCIPFLEHDDATRALMGTNMQRQAVPCIRPQQPLVGTGVEASAAYYSGYVILSEVDGEVTEVDGNHIVVTDKKNVKHTYYLSKFIRSNHSTCVNQTPVVQLGDKVKKGQGLTDGPGIKDGELALGQNMLVAYMVWGRV
jgi:DNA-directed RNA polymerase subunit beta